ncbi:MAG: SurA N-terminal domain-containing protein [Candidatus Omnitrophica bacterium]|nr:SurA N-terminal domain-containing protein [Candidatus Omnitrophota bacterium]
MFKKIHVEALLVVLMMVGLGCSKPQPEEPKADKTKDPFNLTQPVQEEKESSLDCPPGVVALVDDRVITREDAENRARMTLRTKGFDESDPEYATHLAKARKGAVDLLIESYVLQAAATDSIKVSTAEVEQELLMIKTRHPNQASYEEGLRRSNLTEEEFKEVLEKDLRIRKVMAEEAQKGVPIPTQEDARKFYEANSMAFGWPYRVKYDEIIWPLSPEISEASREQAKEEMDDLAVRLQNSPNLFDEILIKSASSSWGPIGLRHNYQTVDQLSEGAQDALETLVVDEISNPFESDLGYSIIRINGTRESYESAEQEILQSIYDDAVARNLEEWKGRLRKKHDVRICDLDYYEGKVNEASEEK